MSAPFLDPAAAGPMHSVPPRWAIESHCVAVSLVPVPTEVWVGRLQQQAALCVPAKLFLSPGGEPGLRAELPVTSAPGRSNALVAQALGATRRWLFAEPPADWNPESEPLSADALQTALEGLSWRSERAEEGDTIWWIHVQEALLRTRLEVSPTRTGCVRVAASSAVRIDSADVARAVCLFALESNRRLRLARLSLPALHERPLPVIWETFLPGELVAAVLEPTVEAVIGAQALTARALRALGQQAVARTYLRLRPGWERLLDPLFSQ